MAPRRGVAQDLLDDDQQDDRRRDDTLQAGDDRQDDDQLENDEEQDDGEQGDDEDELEAGGEQDDGEEQDDDQERRPRQRQQRQQNDDQETPRERELRLRVEAAERLAQETIARFGGQQNQPRETPEQKAARLAVMTPQEYTAYAIQEAVAPLTQQLQQSHVQSANTADAAAFRALLAEAPGFKKYADDVETQHAKFVAQGQYPKRETVLQYLLGAEAMKLAKQAKPKIQEREQRNRRQETRPVRGAGDVRVEQRRGGKTLEDRLAGVAL